MKLKVSDLILLFILSTAPLDNEYVILFDLIILEFLVFIVTMLMMMLVSSTLSKLSRSIVTPRRLLRKVLLRTVVL